MLRAGWAITGCVVLIVAAGCSTGGSSSPGEPSAAAGETRLDHPQTGESTYVALGDSYTSAPGVPVTDFGSGCLRSDHNYPALVAETLGTSYVDVSCGGASTLSLVGVQETQGGPKPPQLDAVAEDTELVTVGIGGNDLSLFSDLVSTCVGVSTPDADGTPCADVFQGPDGDRLDGKIKKIRGRVRAALEGVHDRAPGAEVLLVGYPQLVPASGTCPELPLAPGDYPYVRATGLRLGKALEIAAVMSDSTYIDVLTASRGHDICAGDDAWVNGIITDPERAIAFHPFLEEQQAVAELVVDARG